MNLSTIIIAAGIPSAITGLLIWYLKRKIEKKDIERNKKQEEQLSNMEDLILMMLQSTRANSILCTATAEAVRDGQCNGNMTKALEVVNQVAKKEKEFLLEKSIKYIFE